MTEAYDFDEQQFLNQVQGGGIATKFTPVPEADYPAHVKPGSIKVEKVPFRDGRVGRRFTAQWVIDDPAVAEALGVQEATVRQQFLLDLAADGVSLARGTNKNLRLGKLLVAGGIDPGGEWTFAQLESISAKIRVGHRPDDNDPSIVYAEVRAVTKL